MQNEMLAQSRRSERGFGMIELAIVVLIVGMTLAFSLPGIGRYNESLALKGASSQMASAILLARDRAMATRTSRTMQFQAGYSGTDYRVEVGGVTQAGWTLPKKVSYAWLSGTITSVTITPDGRCSTSGLIILNNTRGLRDTVNVFASGLVRTQ